MAKPDRDQEGDRLAEVKASLVGLSGSKLLPAHNQSQISISRVIWTNFSGALLKPSDGCKEFRYPALPADSPALTELTKLLPVLSEREERLMKVVYCLWLLSRDEPLLRVLLAICLGLAVYFHILSALDNAREHMSKPAIAAYEGMHVSRDSRLLLP